MRNPIVGASLSFALLIAGCAAKPHARTTAKSAEATATPDPRNKVIVHIVSQRQTITVTSSPQGLLYSLKHPDGRVQLADATEARFAELRPELFRQIKHYIAVHADDAPLPADAGMAPVPAQVLTADRRYDAPVPTARHDE